MKILSIEPQKIPDVKLIKFEEFIDHRGRFAEVWSEELNSALNVKFVQLNESTLRENVLRGLHFQWDPPMGKLIRCCDGSVYDIMVDLRKESKTFKKALIIELNYSTEWLWVPPGFAHGVYRLLHNPAIICKVQYFCSNRYNPKCESGIYPFSPGIDFSLCHQSLVRNLLEEGAILSEKDRKAQNLDEWLSRKESNLL